MSGDDLHAGGGRRELAGRGAEISDDGGWRGLCWVAETEGSLAENIS